MWTSFSVLIQNDIWLYFSRLELLSSGESIFPNGLMPSKCSKIHYQKKISKVTRTLSWWICWLKNVWWLASIYFYHWYVSPWLERSRRSIDGLVTVICRRLCDWRRKLDIGEMVSMEIPLVDFATKKSINLRTLIRPGVPLVLNFGSCTWPPFVGALNSFSQVMKKFPKFDYCIIYIAEAHPFDGWKIDNPEQPKVNQPKARVLRTILPVQVWDEKLQDDRNWTEVVWSVDLGKRLWKIASTMQMFYFKK